MPPEPLLTPSPLLQLPNTYRAFYGAFAQLHPVQLRAIAPLLEGRDLVLQAATGVGKTEAVLAPCLERMIRSGRTSTLLYVVPTRALAVDLERRLAPVLNERLALRLGVRTGDVKRAGGWAPDMLVTTPESLDVALGSGNAEVRHFARRVGTVVIDEVHPLVHHYRGWQLAYLLRRLERRTAGPRGDCGSAPIGGAPTRIGRPGAAGRQAPPGAGHRGGAPAAGAGRVPARRLDRPDTRTG